MNVSCDHGRITGGPVRTCNNFFNVGKKSMCSAYAMVIERKLYDFLPHDAIFPANQMDSGW